MPGLSKPSRASRLPGRERAVGFEWEPPVTFFALPVGEGKGPCMKALRVVFRLGLLIGSGIAIPGGWPAAAQTTSPEDAQPPPSGLRQLAGDDARRAEGLD